MRQVVDEATVVYGSKVMMLALTIAAQSVQGYQLDRYPRQEFQV